MSLNNCQEKLNSIKQGLLLGQSRREHNKYFEVSGNKYLCLAEHPLLKIEEGISRTTIAQLIPDLI
jgi:hypothetical protein